MNSKMKLEGCSKTWSSLLIGYEGMLSKFNKGMRSLSILLKLWEIVSKV